MGKVLKYRGAKYTLVHTATTYADLTQEQKATVNKWMSENEEVKKLDEELIDSVDQQEAVQKILESGDVEKIKAEQPGVEQLLDKIDRATKRIKDIQQHYTDQLGKQKNETR